jgi:hypothetical protein
VPYTKLSDPPAFGFPPYQGGIEIGFNHGELIQLSYFNKENDIISCKKMLIKRQADRTISGRFPHYGMEMEHGLFEEGR